MRTAMKLIMLMGGGIVPMSARILATQPSNLIGYWPLGDPTGTTADDVSATNADGTYAGTFTLAQPGIGDGSLSTLFDGASGRVSLTTPISAIDTAMNKAEGALLTWCKVSAAGVWTDASTDFVAEFGVDANNRVYLQKSSANNTLDGNYNAGGTIKAVAFTASPTDWFSFGITWSKSADQMKVYYNGVQQGATQTGLGVWAGSLLNTFTGIADFKSNAASVPWNGYLAHAALWKVALTATEMARIGIL